MEIAEPSLRVEIGTQGIREIRVKGQEAGLRLLARHLEALALMGRSPDPVLDEQRAERRCHTGEAS